MHRLLPLLALAVTAKLASAFPLIAPVLDAETVLTPPACTDFSGLWKGICHEGDGGKTDKTMGIKQSGCESIEVDGFKLAIGGSITVVESIPATLNQPAKSNTTVISAEWNAEKSVLGSRVLYLSRSLGNEESLKSYDSKGEARIAGGKLLLTSMIGETKFTCELEKQP